MNTNSMQKTIAKLAKMIAAELTVGMTGEVEKVKSKNVPATHSCSVPRCHRNAVAKSLCGPHYNKAGKHGMNLDNITKEQLRFLGLDGRALRWQRGGNKAA